MSESKQLIENESSANANVNVDVDIKVNDNKLDTKDVKSDVNVNTNVNTNVNAKDVTLNSQYFFGNGNFYRLSSNGQAIQIQDPPYNPVGQMCYYNDKGDILIAGLKPDLFSSSFSMVLQVFDVTKQQWSILDLAFKVDYYLHVLGVIDNNLYYLLNDVTDVKTTIYAYDLINKEDRYKFVYRLSGIPLIVCQPKKIYLFYNLGLITIDQDGVHLNETKYWVNNLSCPVLMDNGKIFLKDCSHSFSSGLMFDGEQFQAIECPFHMTVYEKGKIYWTSRAWYLPLTRDFYIRAANGASNLCSRQDDYTKSKLNNYLGVDYL